jgi:hypothetical protein
MTYPQENRSSRGGFAFLTGSDGPLRILRLVGGRLSHGLGLFSFWVYSSSFEIEAVLRIMSLNDQRPRGTAVGRSSGTSRRRMQTLTG